MVVKPATELPVVKLLHFSRAREVGGGASSVVQPHLDHMEFEGIHHSHLQLCYNIADMRPVPYTE